MTVAIRPRRVLMTADAVGGVWQYALELVESLRGAGVETLLAVMGDPPTPRQRAAALAIPSLTLVESSFPLEWMQGAEFSLDDAGEWLLDVCRRFEPDVVHLNGYAFAALPWNRPVVVVAHSCVRTWWRAVRRGDVPAEWQDYSDRVRLGLRSAHLVVAPTGSFLRTVRREYGCLLPEAMVVHNARQSGATEGIAKEPIAFAAGRLWDEAKNIQALDKAAMTLPWPVYVAGSATGPGARAPAASALRHLGLLDDGEMRAWQGRASIFVMPSLYEPFGLAALEAAQSGCALVLNNIPTLRELWAGAAIFVNARRPSHLAAALMGLMANPAEAAEWGRRATFHALRYSPGRMVSGYLSAYARARDIWERRSGSRPPETAGRGRRLAAVEVLR